MRTLVSAAAGFVVLSWMFVGCSGSVVTGNGDGGGGAGGSRGGGGGGGMCPGATPADVLEQFMIGSNAMTCPLGRAVPFHVGTIQQPQQAGVSGAVITCSVASSGSGFKVDATVTAGAGTFKVSGQMPSSGTASGISASFSTSNGPGPRMFTVSQTSCTVTLANASTPGFDPSVGPPIARGRVWATVACDDMSFAGQAGESCPGTFLFRLENCEGTSTCP